MLAPVTLPIVVFERHFHTMSFAVNELLLSLPVLWLKFSSLQMAPGTFNAFVAACPRVDLLGCSHVQFRAQERAFIKELPVAGA